MSKQRRALDCGGVGKRKSSGVCPAEVTAATLALPSRRNTIIAIASPCRVWWKRAHKAAAQCATARVLLHIMVRRSTAPHYTFVACLHGNTLAKKKHLPLANASAAW